MAAASPVADVHNWSVGDGGGGGVNMVRAVLTVHQCRQPHTIQNMLHIASVMSVVMSQLLWIIWHSLALVAFIEWQRSVDCLFSGRSGRGDGKGACVEGQHI